VSDVKRSEQPSDELGELADYMLRWKARHRLGDQTRAVVFLENDERCMTALDGWESDHEAIAAVFAHLAAVFEANGQKLVVAPLGRG
jgi:hypothetical protein